MLLILKTDLTLVTQKTRAMVNKWNHVGFKISVGRRESVRRREYLRNGRKVFAIIQQRIHVYNTYIQNSKQEIKHLGRGMKRKSTEARGEVCPAYSTCVYASLKRPKQRPGLA